MAGAWVLFLPWPVMGFRRVLTSFQGRDLGPAAGWPSAPRSSRQAAPPSFEPPSCTPMCLAWLPRAQHPWAERGWAWVLSSRICRPHLSGGRGPVCCAAVHAGWEPARAWLCVSRLVCAWSPAPIPGSAGRSLCLGHTPASAQVPRVTSELASELSQSLPSPR